MITRWAKRANKHYGATRPHKQKHRRLVSHTYCRNTHLLYCSELKSHALRPGSKHHDKPCDIPFNGRGYCVMCTKRTRKMCWGCCQDIGDTFPVCTTVLDHVWQRCTNFEKAYDYTTMKEKIHFLFQYTPKIDLINLKF